MTANLPDPRARKPDLVAETRREWQDIGILDGDKVIALRPVTVHSDDYALQEYGVTRSELDRFVKRMDKRIARARKAGTNQTLHGRSGS